MKINLDSKFSLNIGNHSDVGKEREINEDYFGTFHGNFGVLLVVCDGMGGHKGGEIASRLSVESIKNYFESLKENYNPQTELLAALSAANATLLDYAKTNPSVNNLGSTAVIALFKQGKLFTANLGDSRIYSVKENKIEQLTKDHSLVQQMVDSKMISEEDAKTHPKKNVITKSLGTSIAVEPDVTEPIKFNVSDAFILCTDGLTTHVSDEEILKAVSGLSPQDAANRLVELANERGGTDNITIQIAKVISS